MATRRQLIGGAGAVGAAALMGGCSRLSAATQGVAPAPPGRDLTPDQALQLLIDGNERFLSGAAVSELSSAQRRLALAQSQEPFAAYVTCSDSRVPPEVLFGRGLGELFIIRNAGNTVDTVALGSIEYAVAVLGVPLIVVMGHERCGAVAAATQVVTENATFPGAIGPMIQPIIPSVLKVREQAGDLVDNAIRQNVRDVATRLRTQTDPLMQEPLRAGRLKVVGAYYDLDTGRVDFFDRG